MTHEDLEKLWQQVTENWDDNSSHDLFLQTCFSQGALGYAVAKYRSALSNPEREKLASKKIQAASILAVELLQADRTESHSALPRWILVVAALLCIVAIGWLFWTLSV